MAAPATTFPFRANWDSDAPIRERYGYRTNVMESENGTEQRVQLKAKRIGGISFEAVCQDRAAGLANSILTGAITSALGVPLWQYAAPNFATISAGNTGATVGNGIPLTAPYVAGGWVIIWRSPFDFFVGDVSGVTSSAVLFAGTPFTGGPYPAQSALVMPLISARLSQEEIFNWRSRGIGLLPVSFDYEETFWPAGSSSGSTYLSLQVLDAVRPNRDGDVSDSIRRRFRLLDNVTNQVRITVANTAGPSNIIPFKWSCRSRAAVETLRDFLDARKGRAVPFWLPTWQEDMRLVGNPGAGPTINIEDIGYNEWMFPGSGARRHIMLLDSIGPSYHKVTASTTADQLTITPSLPRQFFAASTLMTFLRYVRLEDDETEITWHSGEVAEATLRCRELHRESPT